MKRLFGFLMCLGGCVMAVAQVFPQFNNKSFDEWTYSRADVELNSYNILHNKITLFTTQAGNTYTLTSPAFSCEAVDTLTLTTTWVTEYWNESYLKPDRVALTVALLNEQGVTVDSVTCAVTTPTKTNILTMKLDRQSGWPSHGQLRLAAWKADVQSNGAVREVVLEVSTRGDVNQDGTVSIADVTALVNALLDEKEDAVFDVNNDGTVSIADITALVNIVLNM